MDFNWKSLLKVVAPTLATAIGGPFGAMAAGVVDAALGLGEGADDAARAEALKKATPEQLLAIQESEQKFKTDIARLGVDLTRLEVDDRKDARNREIQLRDYTPRVLAFLILAGWIGLNYFIFTGDLPVENKDFILRTLGTIDAAVGLVLSYFYGSSANSARKDLLLYSSNPGGK